MCGASLSVATETEQAGDVVLEADDLVHRDSEEDLSPERWSGTQPSGEDGERPASHGHNNARERASIVVQGVCHELPEARRQFGV